MEIIVGASAADVAQLGADWIERRVRRAVKDRGHAYLAISGGSTPLPMLTSLGQRDLPWRHVTVFQVDERCAPDGDPARNSALADLLPVPARQRKMFAAASADIRGAARRYAASLPEQFDVVHLGLGDDGHTASWPPGHDVVRSERTVEAIDTFNGWKRLTLTPTPVNRARARLMEIVGADKADMVRRWVLGDLRLPVTAVRRTATTVLLDSGAASKLDHHPLSNR